MIEWADSRSCLWQDLFILLLNYSNYMELMIWLLPSLTNSIVLEKGNFSVDHNFFTISLLMKIFLLQIEYVNLIRWLLTHWRWYFTLTTTARNKSDVDIYHEGIAIINLNHWGIKSWKAYLRFLQIFLFSINHISQTIIEFLFYYCMSFCCGSNPFSLVMLEALNQHSTVG